MEKQGDNMNPQVKISHSEEIKDFVAALAKAQGALKPAVFNRINPHFKTRYADFTSCMDACRAPLSENGIAAIQYCETIDGKLNLVTMLAHISGQWMKSEFPLIAAKMDSQGIGSAMTYAKRYSLCGMVGIVADEEGDDDAEAAVGRGRQEEPRRYAAPVSKPISRSVEVKPSTITQDEAFTLEGLLRQTPDDYQEKLNDWLKKKNLLRLTDMPKELYEDVMTKLKIKLGLLKGAEAEVTA